MAEESAILHKTYKQNNGLYSAIHLPDLLFVIVPDCHIEFFNFSRFQFYFVRDKRHRDTTLI